MTVLFIVQFNLGFTIVTFLITKHTIVGKPQRYYLNKVLTLV